LTTRNHREVVVGFLSATPSEQYMTSKQSQSNISEDVIFQIM